MVTQYWLEKNKPKKKIKLMDKLVGKEIREFLEK